MATACGIVRVDDVRRQALDDARQLPRRRQIDLVSAARAGRDRALRPRAGELAVGMRHEHRPMAVVAQSEHRQQHLVLSAAPGPRRVDVEGEHRLDRHGSGCALSRLGRRCESRPELGAVRAAAPRASRTSAARSTSSASETMRPGVPVAKCRRAGCSCAGRPAAGGRRCCEQARAPAVLVHLPRRQRRVSIDRLEMIGDVAVGVVLQLAAQRADRARRTRHRLVDVDAASSRADAPVVQAQLPVGIPVGRADPAPQIVVTRGTR